MLLLTVNPPPTELCLKSGLPVALLEMEREPVVTSGVAVNPITASTLFASFCTSTSTNSPCAKASVGMKAQAAKSVRNAARLSARPNLQGPVIYQYCTYVHRSQAQA